MLAHARALFRPVRAGGDSGVGSSTATPPADASLRIERVALDGLDALSPEWDALADRIAAPPWLRPGWVAAWWRAFGRGSLTLLCARRGDTLAGVLPVVRRRGGWLASPTNWHTPEFGMAADGPPARRALADAVLASGAPVTAIALLAPGGTGLAELLDAARASRRRVIVREQMRSPWIDLRAWEPGLPVPRRRRGWLKDLRRCRRKLEATGSVHHEVAEGAQAVRVLREECLELEAAGWKGRRGSAIVSDPRTRAFYGEVAEWSARRGALRVTLLRHGRRLIAFHLGIEDAGSLRLLKGAFAEDMRQHSPGRLLLFETIAWARERGLSRVDLLGGDEPYKRPLADARDERLLVQAFTRGPAGTAMWAAWRWGRPALLRAKARGQRAIAAPRRPRLTPRRRAPSTTAGRGPPPAGAGGPPLPARPAR